MAQLFNIRVQQLSKNVLLKNVKQITIRLRAALGTGQGQIGNNSLILFASEIAYVANGTTAQLNLYATVNGIQLHKYTTAVLDINNTIVPYNVQQSSDTLNFIATDENLINQELQCTLTQEALAAGYYLEIFGVQI